MSGSQQPGEPMDVFCSYSQKDEKLRGRLETHLSNLKRQKIISSWHDHKITAGEKWAGQIDQHLETAHIILLLVSADFLASDYCYDIELRRAIERHEAGEARLIPIILRPCDWQEALFGQYQALPKNGRPVTLWNPQDAAFAHIASGIRQAVEHIHANKSARQIPKRIDKRRLPDEELFRIAAEGDTQSFEILASRLRFLKGLISAWCRDLQIPTDDSVKIAQDTIKQAVLEVRQTKRVPPREQRSGWLEDLAKREFERWFQPLQLKKTSQSLQRQPRPQLSEDQRKIREQEEMKARYFLDWIVDDKEREIMERVLGEGQDLIEAGSEIPVRDEQEAHKLLYQALKKLMNIIHEYGDEIDM